jgi:RNA polymerase sigma-70 factor (ECF subfamily)
MFVPTESVDWPRALASCGYDAAYARLHPLLLRFARRELGRRAWIGGPELDDLAHQATADALVAIRRRLPEFRGESRFETWAYKFVLFEVAKKSGRHFWRVPHTPMDAEDWERLPDRFGLDPTRESESRELLDALRRAVDEVLTEHQRRVFVAVILNDIFRRGRARRRRAGPRDRRPPARLHPVQGGLRGVAERVVAPPSGDIVPNADRCLGVYTPDLIDSRSASDRVTAFGRGVVAPREGLKWRSNAQKHGARRGRRTGWRSAARVGCQSGLGVARRHRRLGQLARVRRDVGHAAR